MEDDDGFELVDLIDLGSPLQPLGTPIDDLAKDWIFPLPLTLEDFYHCAMQHYRITRTLKSGKTQEVKIDIKINPGWRTGTRIRIARTGNQRADGSYQDIVFVVKEIPHPRFTRIGDDLHLPIHVPARPKPLPYDIVRAGQKTPEEQVYVYALNEEKFALPIPRSPLDVASGTRIVGGGMPVQRNGNNVGKGDLIVK